MSGLTILALASIIAVLVGETASKHVTHKNIYNTDVTFNIKVPGEVFGHWTYVAVEECKVRPKVIVREDFSVDPFLESKECKSDVFTEQSLSPKIYLYAFNPNTSVSYEVEIVRGLKYVVDGTVWKPLQNDTLDFFRTKDLFEGDCLTLRTTLQTQVKA